MSEQTLNELFEGEHWMVSEKNKRNELMPIENSLEEKRIQSWLSLATNQLPGTMSESDRIRVSDASELQIRSTWDMKDPRSIWIMMKTDLQTIFSMIPVKCVEAKVNVLTIVDFDEDQTIQRSGDLFVEFDGAIRRGKGLSARRSLRSMIRKIFSSMCGESCDWNDAFFISTRVFELLW